jgi:hypothetical protein
MLLAGHSVHEAPFTRAAPDPPNRRNRARTRLCCRLPFQTKAVGFTFQPATVSSSQSITGLCHLRVLARQRPSHHDALHRFGHIQPRAGERRVEREDPVFKEPTHQVWRQVARKTRPR